MSIPGFPGFLGGILKFKVDSSFSRSPDYHDFNDWMQRYGQKTSKMPKKWGVPPICDPQDFLFKNQALSLLYPYGALTSCKKLEKTNERSLRYSKTDHGLTDQQTDQRTRAITKDPLR